MKMVALVIATLTLGGCLADGDTANNRSVLPLAGAPSRRDMLADEPRQLCEDTMEAGQPKTVCY